MVKVSVRQDYAVDTVGFNAEIPVFFVGFRAGPLKRPAVDKIAFPINFEYVLGARYFFRGAKGVKLYIHGVSIMLI
jgi:hypothetical protein